MIRKIIYKRSFWITVHEWKTNNVKPQKKWVILMLRRLISKQTLSHYLNKIINTFKHNWIAIFLKWQYFGIDCFFLTPKKSKLTTCLTMKSCLEIGTWSLRRLRIRIFHFYWKVLLWYTERLSSIWIVWMESEVGWE